jgi:hypothetical protein
MKSGFEPKSFKTYNLTPEEQVELDKFLKENLDKGYIKPSQSPMASLFFFVKKKDGKLQPCQDYQYLNDWTVKNAYPLLLISEIMDKIKGAKFFTKFDVRWGYNNVRIKTEDQWKAAFKTNRGLFEPMVMFFGMCNSPATFQAMMDSIFSDMIEGQKVIVYMDDILIFAENQEELQERMKQVLQQPWDHKIEMKSGFEPKSFKTYNLMPEEQVELDKFLKENLDKGYIKPSQSPMASLFFFVKKKDGKLRPCQDYRYLNDWTVKNAYPLPLISKIMDKIKGTKFFTKFDVRWGYNNVRIKAEDQWKAAFKTNQGLFEPTVMFFGMCNSPATFQAMMDSIFSDMIEGQKVIVYMDNILIFAESQKELQERTKQVLQRL